jgi:stage II sporulation protein AA (anti-sigma F factor antagonist)
MLGTCPVIGEIDLATAPALRADLRNTIDRSDTDLVVVDCSGVTFMDSGGYHALADETAYASRHGHALVIRNPSPSCALVLRLCDWDGLHREDPEGLQ